MNKKVLNIAIITSVVLVFVGIGCYVYTNIKSALNYCYKVVNFSISNINKDGISLKVRLALLNNSEISATIEGYNFGVWINDIKIATIKESIKKQISPKVINYIDIPVTINPKEFGSGLYEKVLNVLSTYLLNKDKVIVKVEGSFSANVVLWSVRDYPISISMSVKEIMTNKTTESDICKNFNTKVQTSFFGFKI